MPTYSYECKKCSHTFDLFHAITADPSVKCPECGSKCRRLIGTGAGIIFKGSGFYETDYKRNGNGSGGNGAPAAKKSDGAGAAKAETAGSAKASSSSSSTSSD